jgi:hypothetical protein
MPTIQGKTQIKIVMNRIHGAAAPSTEGIMQPNSDPFSRARIPYLECIPPRKINTSTADNAVWEKINSLRYCPLEELSNVEMPFGRENVLRRN